MAFDHVAIEVNTIGREGMVGFIAALGVPPRALARDVVQVPGRALRLPLATLREAVALVDDFRARLKVNVSEDLACEALGFKLLGVLGERPA